MHVIVGVGSWWLFARFGFTGLSAQDYLGVILVLFISSDMLNALSNDCILNAAIAFVFSISYWNNFFIN